MIENNNINYNSSERDLQNLVIEQLVKNNWEYEKGIHNYDALLDNFKKIVEIRNAQKLEKLGKVGLSDTEFDRLINKINDNRNTFSDYAYFLLDGDFELVLDDNKKVYINLYDKKKFCCNKFQVVEELSNNGIRNDIVLLINGLPLCNIELKKPSVKIQNAYEQTKDYSTKYRGLMKFIQIFIVSNKDNTKYYANNRNINAKFVFDWVDKENQRVTNIFKFIDQFLDTCFFSEYISKFVINKKKEDVLLAMRGYQVHGAKSIINHLKISKDNGYIWHATGSGKTITSFKVSQIIANDLEQFDKVVFLVDRRDLDSQTISEYNSFLDSFNQIEQTTRAEVLFKQIKSQANKLVITTMQKLDRLLSSTSEEVISGMNSVKKLNIVFIVDECHRSQFGDMHARIREHFVNARYVGFTGTPIFADENNPNKLSTNDMFGKNVHKYLIQDAIADKNVLPFQIDYYSAQTLLDEINENQVIPSETQKQKEEVIKEYLKSDKYINSVVDSILTVHKTKTRKNEFIGMLAVQNIDTLIKFYKRFKEVQEQRLFDKPNYKKLRISATFSIGNSHLENDIYRKEELSKIILDFNGLTNSNESIDDVNSFNNRLQKVIKNDNKYEETEIDLVIVVDQLLTGFDAKKLNTLYVAKNMQGHGLIQAFSRTNRVYNTNKEVAIIVSYVPNLKENVDAAILKYSDSNNADAFCARDYASLKKSLRTCWSEIQNFSCEDILEDPLGKEETVKTYFGLAKDITDTYRQIRTMGEFTNEDIAPNFNMDNVNELVSNTKLIRAKIVEIQKSGPIIEGPLVDKNPKVKNTNLLDELDIPLTIENINTVNEEYIRNMLIILRSYQEQNNDLKTISIMEDITNKLKSSNIAIADEISQINELIKVNPKIDVTNELIEKGNEIKSNFKNRYKTDDVEVTQELKYYDIKNRFNEENVNKFAKNSGAKLKERRTEKVTILEKLSKIKMFRDLFA